MRRLSDYQIERAVPGRNAQGKPCVRMYADAQTPTLYLRTSASGAKSWIQRILIDGRRVDLGLGGWPVVTLKKARKKALKNRRMVRKGKDPIAKLRKTARNNRSEARRNASPSFREAAEKKLDGLSADWKGGREGKQARQWLRSLELHAFARLGDMAVHEIERQHVLKVLAPIWETKPSTARSVRRAIRDTLAWAQSFGYVDTNEAAEAIDGALSKARPKRTHFAAVPHGAVADTLQQVEKGTAGAAAKLALRFLVLTATRQCETRGAVWSEINTEARTWTIPASRMKSKRKHCVPLSDAAMRVLQDAKTLPSPAGYIFPSPIRPRNRISDRTVANALHTVVTDATLHGFRSSFRDWCAVTQKDRQAAEFALAHKVKDATEASYFRDDLLEIRRPIMQEWGQYATAGNVVTLESRRSA